jgi:hypothetical protein
MGRGMTVAADDGGAGQSPALLRADDVNDALADIVHGEIFHAEFAGVPGQGLDLLARLRIGDALGAIGGGHIVIGHRQSEVGAAHFAPGSTQALERLGAGHFMDEMAVDIEDGRFARLFLHQMRVPDLVV